MQQKAGLAFRASSGLPHTTVHKRPTALFKQAVLEAFSKGQVCVDIFLDISKAYDGVWRDRLREKFHRKIGMRGRLSRWIRDFLSERGGRVVYRGMSSPEGAYPYGIFQGTVLSPILHNFITSDIF